MMRAVEDGCVLFMSTVLVVGGTSRFMPTLHFTLNLKKKKELVEICNLIDGPQYQGMALLSAFTICKCTSS